MNTKNAHPNTLFEAVAHFAQPGAALAFFVKMRWPDGVVACPRCGSINVRFIEGYDRWECREKHASKQFTVKIGTVMEDSPIKLDKWAVAFWLEANAKNSISSYEVHRALGITQKSAWFMQHRIRLAMQSKHAGKLGGNGGIVEADESYIGGKARNMHKSVRARRIGAATGMAGKAVVMGLLERKTGDKHSTVRTEIIPVARRDTLHPVVKANVEKGSELHTDAHSGYTMLGPDFVHKFIDHAECYVRDNVHTNGLENFWSLLKRSIGGTHVAVEPFHLFRYLDAQAFRFNNRKVNDGERFRLAIKGVAGKRLTYKALIGATAASEGHKAGHDNDAASGERLN